MDKKSALDLANTIVVDKRVKMGLIKPINSVTKYQYNELMSVYNFVIANPSLTEEQIKKVLKCKPNSFGFVLKCARKVENFFTELKMHGVIQMIETLNHQKNIDEFAYNNL
ncbi:MAG: hypothetical protein IKM43_01220 [Clostridia bacterium]|nr:hypothetical protein [Clostridia bacterium]